MSEAPCARPMLVSSVVPQCSPVGQFPCCKILCSLHTCPLHAQDGLWFWGYSGKVTSVTLVSRGLHLEAVAQHAGVLALNPREPLCCVHPTLSSPEQSCPNCSDAGLRPRVVQEPAGSLGLRKEGPAVYSSHMLPHHRLETSALPPHQSETDRLVLSMGGSEAGEGTGHDGPCLKSVL